MRHSQEIVQVFVAKDSALTDNCLKCYGYDGRVLRTRGSEVTDRSIFPVWECFVPNVGIFHSQCGNFLCLIDASVDGRDVGEIWEG